MRSLAWRWNRIYTSSTLAGNESKVTNEDTTGWLSGSRLLTLAAWVLVIGVVGLLADQNRTLKAELERRARPPAGLEPGDQIPSFALTGTANESTELVDLMGGEGGVIAVFTTTCPYCEENLPNWDRLATALEAAQLPFLGVSLHPAAETANYVSSHDLDWPVWVAESSAASRLKIQAVPTTIVYSANGNVHDAWRGVLPDDVVDEILAAVSAESG